MNRINCKQFYSFTYLSSSCLFNVTHKLIRESTVAMIWSLSALFIKLTAVISHGICVHFFSYLFTASAVYLASSSPHCFGFSLIRERRRGRVAIIALRHSQATNKSVVFEKLCPISNSVLPLFLWMWTYVEYLGLIYKSCIKCCLLCYSIVCVWQYIYYCRRHFLKCFTQTHTIFPLTIILLYSEIKLI